MSEVIDQIAPMGTRPRAVNIIDGHFFYNVRQNYFKDDEWDHRYLERFADLILPRYHWRFRTYYGDSYPVFNESKPTESHEKRDIRKKEFNFIEALERFTVLRGESRRREKNGYATFESLPKGIDQEPFRHHKMKLICVEQKQVDVLIASAISRIAYSGEAKHITLFAGDQDFIPAVQIAKNAGAIVRIVYYRGSNSKTSELLMNVADERRDSRPAFEQLKKEVDEGKFE